MALADYRLCDVCNRKAFYDANLDYQDTEKGHPMHPDTVPVGLGAWAVLCLACTKTHRVTVERICALAEPSK